MNVGVVIRQSRGFPEDVLRETTPNPQMRTLSLEPDEKMYIILQLLTEVFWS
jgi:hypothetical protein